MKKTLREFDFDTSDTDDVGRNVAPHRPGGVKRVSGPDPRAPKQHPTSHLPGLPPEKRKTEATPTNRRTRSTSTTVVEPMTGPQVTPQQAAASLQAKAKPAGGPTQTAPQAASPMTAPKTRSQNVTQQVTPQGNALNAKESDWDVTVPGAGTYRTKATDANRAGLAIQAHLLGGGDPDVKPDMMRGSDVSSFQVKPTAQESLGQIGLEAFRQMVNARIQEIVRKKEGGGGYNLYSPNKGKKKTAKPVGEFPTRLAAKRAELARFPPKDPEQLKRARKRLDKLAKDPKKKQDVERKELSAKKPRRSGKSSGERKARKEALIAKMANQIAERLFREDEVPGSPWDERIANLHPDALGQDKKLHRYHQGMEKASVGALGDSHKALAKLLRGLAKVNPGEIGIDPDRGKMFMPVGLDVDGSEIGPIHLYVDGGNVCIELSEEAREAIAGLDPMMAKDLRGGLMSFQEDHLPKIDRAKKAWSERDAYLDKLHQRLEKSFGGMSEVEHHLMRQLMASKRKRR